MGLQRAGRAWARSTSTNYISLVLFHCKAALMLASQAQKNDPVTSCFPASSHLAFSRLPRVSFAAIPLLFLPTYNSLRHYCLLPVDESGEQWLKARFVFPKTGPPKVSNFPYYCLLFLHLPCRSLFAYYSPNIWASDPNFAYFGGSKNLKTCENGNCPFFCHFSSGPAAARVDRRFGSCEYSFRIASFRSESV